MLNRLKITLVVTLVYDISTLQTSASPSSTRTYDPWVNSEAGFGLWIFRTARHSGFILKVGFDTCTGVRAASFPTPPASAAARETYSYVKGAYKEDLDYSAVMKFWQR